MKDGLGININTLLPIQDVYPDEAYSPFILAVLPDGAPMVLYWIDGCWRDAARQERTFLRWVYLTGE